MNQLYVGIDLAYGKDEHHVQRLTATQINEITQAYWDEKNRALEQSRRACITELLDIVQDCISKVEASR